MADRTYGQLYVKGLPSLGAATLITEAWYGAGYLSGTDLVSAAQDLLDGLGLTDESMNVGSSGEVAARLDAVIAETGLQVQYMLWEDPAYEYVGEIHRYAPSLGKFSADCSSSGEVLITGSAVGHQLKNPLHNLDSLKAWLHKEAGRDWVLAWDA